MGRQGGGCLLGLRSGPATCHLPVCQYPEAGSCSDAAAYQERHNGLGHGLDTAASSLSNAVNKALNITVIMHFDAAPLLDYRGKVRCGNAPDRQNRYL